jgi:peptidoglycan hydrolase-like protein with peptidoglycan-binding domain
VDDGMKKGERQMAEWPIQKNGSTGEDVRTVQYLLRAHGAAIAVDGAFGPLTDGAVRAFQGGHGLAVDGIVGNATWPALVVTVQQGDTGDAVRAVQRQIRARINRPAVDGVFGPVTDSLVRAFQGAAELTADGIVGPLTWHELVVDHLGATSGCDAVQALFVSWMNTYPEGAVLNARWAAVTDLFTHTWSAADGWVFAGCTGAAGHVIGTWNRPGHTLMLQANNNTGAPFYYVTSVSFS